MFKKHIRQKGAVDDEAEVITSLGKIKSVHISASVTKVGNRPIMQGIFRDITERKNIEKMKDNLLRDVSHTLKTPIAMLEMAYDMSERGIRDQDIGRIQNSQEIITNNIARLHKEIDNILNLFTLSETKPIEKKEKVSLAQITNEVIHSLKSIIDRKGLAIKINIAQAAERIFMDKRQIEILLNNIIDNAIKFTEGGSVSIAVSQEGRFVKLIVADTGCGIAAKEKTKLFNAFYKRHAALPGAGLGLSICQTIVNRNKGTIKIISGGIGRGTTVIVKLPKGG